MKKNILLVIALLMFATVGAFAQVPVDFSIQGYAEDNASAPYNTNISVLFEVYDVATGGTAIHSQTQTVTATNGYFEFRTTFPSQATITNAAKNQLYYQFTIEGVAQTRVPFAAVPYSVATKYAETAFLADSATPHGPAGGHLEGTYPNPTLREEAVGSLIERYIDANGVTAVPKGPAGGDIGGNYPNELLIKNRAVKTNHIAIGGITADNIGPAAITTNKIAPEAITTNTLAKAPGGFPFTNKMLVYNPMATNIDGTVGAWSYIPVAEVVASGIVGSSVEPFALPFLGSDNTLGSSFVYSYPMSDPTSPYYADGFDAVQIQPGVALFTDELYIGAEGLTDGTFVTYGANTFHPGTDGALLFNVGDVMGSQRATVNFHNSNVAVTGKTTTDSLVNSQYAGYSTSTNYGTPYGADVATGTDQTDKRFASIGLLNAKMASASGLDLTAMTANALTLYDGTQTKLVAAPLLVDDPTTPTIISSTVPYRYSGALDATTKMLATPAMPSDSDLATVGYVKANGGGTSGLTTLTIPAFDGTTNHLINSPLVLNGTTNTAQITSTGLLRYSSVSPTNYGMPTGWSWSFNDGTGAGNALATVEYVDRSIMAMKNGSGTGATPLPDLSFPFYKNNATETDALEFNRTSPLTVDANTATMVQSTVPFRYAGPNATTANQFMATTLSTVDDADLATVAYVKANGGAMDNFWASDVPADFKKLTTFAPTLFGSFPYPQELGMDTSNTGTVITGNVLFSPNATNNRAREGFISMPYHVVTIGAQPGATTLYRPTDGTGSASALTVFTRDYATGSDQNSLVNDDAVGIRVVPGLPPTTSGQRLTATDRPLNSHIGFTVDFAADPSDANDKNHYYDGIAGLFTINGSRDTSTSSAADGVEAGPSYSSAGLMVMDYNFFYNAGWGAPGGLFWTQNPAMAIVGITELQGPIVIPPQLHSDMEAMEGPTSGATSNSATQNASVYAESSSFSIGHGWHGQIIWIVNTSTTTPITATFPTFAGAAIEQTFAIASGKAISLIFVESDSPSATDKGKWYPVVAPTP